MHNQKTTKRDGYYFQLKKPSTKTDKEPTVSIIIPNYNGKKTLENCIKSILEQDFDEPIEIIIHDDNSPDKSAELLLEKYPMVFFQFSKENVGFCKSNNRMASAAHGEFLLLLNNDATLDQGALKAMLTTSQQQSPKGIVSPPQYQAATGELVDYGYHLDIFLNPIPRTTINEQEIAMVIGACLWLPLELWQKIGGFPEWFDTNAEDMYLCLVAKLMGRPINTCPESGYHHWIGASLGGGKPNEKQKLQTTYRRRILSERNKNYVMCCTYPMALLTAILPLHFLLLIIEGLTLSFISRNTKPISQIYLNSITSCWKSRTLIKQKRTEIKRKTSIGTTQLLRGFKATPQKVRLALQHGIPKIS